MHGAINFHSNPCALPKNNDVDPVAFAVDLFIDNHAKLSYGGSNLLMSV